MKIYTEVIFEWCEDKQCMVEVSSKSEEWNGPVALCGGGGGGSSGEVKFAAYIEDFHKELMDDAGADTINSALSVFNAANLALTADPYQSVNAWNPDAEISAMDTAYTTGYTDYSNLDPAGDIKTYATQAKIAYDSIVDDSDINEAVNNFDNESKPEFQTQLAQMSGMMADIGALNSTAYVWGMAGLHRKRYQTVTKFRSDLKLKSWEKRLEYITTAKKMMMSVLGEKLKFGLSWAGAKAEHLKVRGALKNDQIKFDTEYDVKNAMWEMNLVERGLKAIGAPGGGSAVVPNEPSQGQSALAGAASGAAAGAALGPWGAAAGAGIGALMSLA